MYPGTGTVDEVGVDAGAGKTINVPLPGGADDADYLEAFEKVFIPALEVHAPDLIVVSAGYDAHHLDPISEMEVTAPGFHRMATLLMEAARTVCDGKVVFVLEGGYDYHALPECVEETLNAVAGRPVAHPDDQARPTRPEYREAVRAYLRHAIETHCARLGL
jgi:acetoin utilization deacetylase AcuC-like enzyme